MANVTKWLTLQNGRCYEVAKVTKWHTLQNGSPDRMADVTKRQMLQDGRPSKMAAVTNWPMYAEHGRLVYLSVSKVPYAVLMVTCHRANYVLCQLWPFGS